MLNPIVAPFLHNSPGMTFIRLFLRHFATLATFRHACRSDIIAFISFYISQWCIFFFWKNYTCSHAQLRVNRYTTQGLHQLIRNIYTAEISRCKYRTCIRLPHTVSLVMWLMCKITGQMSLCIRVTHKNTTETVTVRNQLICYLFELRSYLATFCQEVISNHHQ